MAGYGEKREVRRETKLVWITTKHLRARDLVASNTMSIDRVSKKIVFRDLTADQVEKLIAILDEEFDGSNGDG